MQTVLDKPTSTSTVSRADAQLVASAYVADQVDPAFEVVDGARYYSKPLSREIWRFFVRCAQGPVGVIRVDAQTGAVNPLTTDEIRAMHEKAAIFVARQQGVLAVDTQGYVLAEYARRQADSYLGTEVSLFYSATDGIFVPLVRPIWQFSIQVRLPRLGVLGIMGTLDVDAQSGEVIPLTHKQIKRIRERADALVEFRTQTTAA
ncbi:MAG TPA: hypothetical protein PKE45_00730 [Caldilineaceae bacterium]|nr:hypothetical protein [Caldilineaceae bacterium]